jgi:hypothetical protein
MNSTTQGESSENRPPKTGGDAASGEAVNDRARGRDTQRAGQERGMAGTALDQPGVGRNDRYAMGEAYGKANFGMTAFIALGVGVGVGLLIAGGVGASHGRRNRLVGPVVNALSELAREFIR